MSKTDRKDALKLTGRVVAAYGRHAIIEDAHQQRFRCKMKGKRLRPVCADDVEWRMENVEGGDGMVTAILPRRTELSRPDGRGRAETIASNMTQLIIVIAPRPEPDLSLVDRYLVSAELSGVAAVVVANKSDLGDIDLSSFAMIEYPTVSVCAKRPESLDKLIALLANHVSIFVGQSGVGKSSLLNAMIPGLDSRTQELSVASGDGRHTTTASMLHHLNNHAEVIDSPGVRDFAPPPISDRELAAGFIEFREPSTLCRFNDCRHLSEPDCGVREAVTSGQISQRRYSSYTHLHERLARLNPDTYS